MEIYGKQHNYMLEYIPRALPARPLEHVTAIAYNNLKEHLR